MSRDRDRPLPGCPARVGAGSFDMAAADFILEVRDCHNGVGPGVPVTEIFGFFMPLGWQEAEHGDGDSDAVLTATFEPPAGSPMAVLAHRANTDTGTALIADKLRAAISRVPVRRPGQLRGAGRGKFPGRDRAGRQCRRPGLADPAPTHDSGIVA